MLSPVIIPSIFAWPQTQRRTEQLKHAKIGSIILQIMWWVHDKILRKFIDCKCVFHHLFQETATSRFDLICDQSDYGRIAQFIFFSGTLVGVFVGGILADKFGRLWAYKFWLIVFIVSTFAEAFVTDFWTWSVLRFIAGGSSIAYNTCQTVYVVEFSGQKWRSITNNYFRYTKQQFLVE